MAKDAADYSKHNPAASSKGYWKGKGSNSTGHDSGSTGQEKSQKGAKGDQKGAKGDKKGGKPAPGQSWKEYKKSLKHG